MDAFNFVGSINVGVLDANQSAFLEDIYLALLVLWIYMFPAFISEQRKHHQHLAITVLNLVLGWTVLGWAIALVWACTNVEQSQTADMPKAKRYLKPLEGEIIPPPRAAVLV